MRAAITIDKRYSVGVSLGILGFLFNAVSAHLLRAQPAPTPPAEPDDGMWMRADTTVFRLSPGDTATTTFYASIFGKRSPGTEISLGYDSSIMEDQTTQGPIQGPQIVGSPQSALTFPTSITTANDGTATLTVVASDPEIPRQYIDGQIYGVNYGLDNAPPPAGSANNSGSLVC